MKPRAPGTSWKEGGQLANGKYEQWLEPEGLLKLEGWARDGLTEDQIARNIGISRSTLSEWKKKYPDISDTLKRGKEIVDLQVENALLKRALGYSYQETTKELCVNAKTGETEMRTVKIVEKEVLPDTTAQIFWLKNRKPGTWREKQNLELSGLEEEKSKLDDIIRQIKDGG